MIKQKNKRRPLPLGTIRTCGIGWTFLLIECLNRSPIGNMHGSIAMHFERAGWNILIVQLGEKRHSFSLSMTCGSCPSFKPFLFFFLIWLQYFWLWRIYNSYCFIDSQCESYCFLSRLLAGHFLFLFVLVVFFFFLFVVLLLWPINRGRLLWNVNCRLVPNTIVCNINCP